nr:MAG TPA_asm: hypothetical protein [Caudoviricetes sp.]
MRLCSGNDTPWGLTLWPQQTRHECLLCVA